MESNSTTEDLTHAGQPTSIGNPPVICNCGRIFTDYSIYDTEHVPWQPQHDFALELRIIRAAYKVELNMAHESQRERITRELDAETARFWKNELQHRQTPANSKASSD